MDPLVSIIIPVYNASKYVEQSVYSAINQTYRNIEVIAVDDGSTDNSYELLKTIKDTRLKVFKQLNQGACVARNRGIQESTGEYVKFLDADDFLYQDAIERQVEQSSGLAKNEEVFGDFDFVDNDGAVFCHIPLRILICWKTIKIVGCTLIGTCLCRLLCIDVRILWLLVVLIFI